MTELTLTERQKDAIIALDKACAGDSNDGTVTPSGFALRFWPGKVFARGNGPWGLGPDASGRHGARMLTTLNRLGLATIIDHDVYWTAKLSHEGRKMLDRILESKRSDEGMF